MPGSPSGPDGDWSGPPPVSPIRPEPVAPRPFVPPELTVAPFHRRDALRAGLTADNLRARCWRRLFHNVFVYAGLVLTDELRLTAARLAAPADAVVTGLTAAWLYGVWQPRPGATLPLELATVRAPRGPGARSVARAMVLDPIDVNEWHGVPITSPERTCFQLMARSALVEAVVFADVFWHAGLVTQRGLLRFADERPHWPHVRKVRFAVDLARREAASPGETRLRLVIVLAGLPEPMFLNVGIYAEDGTLLGIPDMLYLLPIFGLEYDGAYHDDPAQRARDNVRENRLLLGDVPLLRYGARDVSFGQERIIRDVSGMLGVRPRHVAA